MANNFVEGVDVDELFPKRCEEGGPLSQTQSEAAGCWQSSPVSCCWGRAFLLCKHCEWLAQALTPLVSRRAQLFFLEALGVVSQQPALSFKACYTQGWLLSSSLEITLNGSKDESRCK